MVVVGVAVIVIVGTVTDVALPVVLALVVLVVVVVVVEVVVVVDVDESFELYGFLKQKKMINGIPAILAYYTGNVTYIPDDSVVGADANQVRMFFERCYNQTVKS